MSGRRVLSNIYPDYGSWLNWFWHMALFCVFPRHLWAPMRAEIHLAIVRLRCAFRRRSRFPLGQDLLVNIGAGPYGRPDWINVDGWKHPGVNIVHDCRRSLPLLNNSARGILCEHFLEHIDFMEEVPVFLSECWRALRPGGILRLVVPDAEQYLVAYATPGWDLMRHLRDTRQYQTKMEVVNEVFRGGGWRHKFAYDYETLECVVKRAGFRSVSRKKFGESAHPDLAIDRSHHSRESLYVEAVK